MTKQTKPFSFSDLKLFNILRIVYKYILLTKLVRSRWLDIGLVLFLRLYGLRLVSVHKNAKRERGQYPVILTELAWSIKDLSYGIKSTEKMIFVLVCFRALKRKPVICKSDNAFRFSRFLIPSRQKNQTKSFYCHGKYFAKENVRAPAWTSAKCYCGNKTGNPERAVSLHLARLGSQSQRGIWFILPARGACHIMQWK